MIRVIWKDSFSRDTKPVSYRGHHAYGCGNGWATDIPGDYNIYKSHYCALNAIDSALGERTRKGSPTRKRLNCGIDIVGKREPPQ